MQARDNSTGDEIEGSALAVLSSLVGFIVPTDTSYFL